MVPGQRQPQAASRPRCCRPAPQEGRPGLAKVPRGSLSHLEESRGSCSGRKATVLSHETRREVMPSVPHPIKAEPLGRFCAIPWDRGRGRREAGQVGRQMEQGLRNG